MKISKKEKFLLIILILVVIVLGGFKLLIEPRYDKLRTARQNFVEAEVKKKEADSFESKLKKLTDENIEIEEIINENSKNIMPKLESDKLNVYFNTILSELDIDILQLELSEVTSERITPYVNLGKYHEYKAYLTAQNIKSIKEKNEVIPVQENTKEDNPEEDLSFAIEKRSVSITFTGSYNKLNQFLDAVRDTGRTVYVNTIGITSAGGSNLNYVVVFDCYGIDKINTVDLLSAYSAPTPNGKTNPFD